MCNDASETNHYLSRFEFILDAMLESLLLRLRVGNDETIAHEMSRIPVPFRRAEPVEIRLLFLDHAVGNGIDAEPRGDREAILIRPCFNRR